MKDDNERTNGYMKEEMEVITKELANVNKNKRDNMMNSLVI